MVDSKRFTSEDRYASLTEKKRSRTCGTKRPPRPSVYAVVEEILKITYSIP